MLSRLGKTSDSPDCQRLKEPSARNPKCMFASLTPIMGLTNRIAEAPRHSCPVYQERGRPEKCTDPSTEPHLREIGEAHRVACHFPL
jgi:hypothetical protein